jgi:hypothetical protein
MKAGYLLFLVLAGLAVIVICSTQSWVSPATTQTLLEQAISSSSDTSKERAVVALMDRKELSALRSLAIRTDVNPHVRALAIKGLGAMRCYEATPDLLQVLDDPEIEVRAESVLALSQILGYTFPEYDPKADEQTQAEVAMKYQAIYHHMQEKPPPPELFKRPRISDMAKNPHLIPKAGKMESPSSK